MFISNINVKMIRLQWEGTTQPVKHNSGVTVGIPRDPATSIVYLRISVDQKVYILSKGCGNLQNSLFKF